MNDKKIVGIGGAHVDWIAQMTVAHVPGASTPGRVTTYAGGCCLNSLRVLSQLLVDHTITIISARGGDSAGEQVQAAIDQAGLIDQSAIFLDRETPTYTAILDTQGDVSAAVADMALYEEALPRHLGRREVRDTLESADVLIIDANLPAETIERITSGFDGMKIGFAISPAKATRLTPSATQLDLVFMNSREHRALGDLTALGFKNAVITNGNKDVLVMQRGKTASLPVPETTEVLDVTGAGDALAGATIASLLKNLEQELAEAIEFGILAAIETINTNGPVGKFTWDALLAKAEQDAG